MAEMRWFRMYTDAVDNPKLRLLAFEDRWHYVAICCLQRSGLLDNQNDAILDRKIAVKLGLQVRDLDEVKRRLIEVNLIADNWKPIGWDERQYESDSSAERTRRYRERKRHSDVTVTPPDTDTESDTDRTPSASLRARKRAPEDFAVSVEMYEWAYSTLGLSAEVVDFETAKFLDHTFATARKDWPATWRNWMRNVQSPKGATQRKTRYEELMEQNQ